MPGLRTASVLIAVAAVLIVGSARAQEAKNPGVYYSYEKLTTGNTAQYVLMPRPLPVDFSGDARADLEMVFSVLKKAKGSTYGNSQLQIRPKDLKKGKVSVQIDPEKNAYYLIIAAETVNTFGDLGIVKVAFPGVTDGPLSRDDIPFAVFQLTVPMWRALPPAQIHAALIRMPDGELIAGDMFYDRVKRRDAKLVKMIFAQLKSDDPLVVTGVLRTLPGLSLPGWEAEVLPLFAHPNARVRLAAVQSFDQTRDAKVLAALVPVMDNDEAGEVQTEAARILAESGDEQYTINAVYFKLRSSDELTAMEALSELRTLKDTRAVAEVTLALGHESEVVASEAIAVLKVLGASDTLLKALTQTDLRPGVREAAALALRDDKNAAARFEGLTYLVSQGSKANALMAVEDLDGFADEKVLPVFIATLAHTEQDVRLLVAGKLAEKRDTEALGPLSAAASAHPEDAEVVEQAALTIMESQSLTETMAFTRNKDPFVKRVAFRVLGNKAVEEGAPEAYEIIKQGVASKDPGVRGACALALGAYKSDEALEILTGLAKDPETIVRRDAAASIGRFPVGSGSHTLIALLEDGEPAVARAAVLAFRERGERQAMRALTAMSKHPDPEVRKAIIVTLPVLATPQTTGEVISFVSNALFDSDQSVQLLAIDILGGFHESTAVDGLSLLLQDPNLEMQSAAILALGHTGHAEAFPLIQSVLYNPHPEVRRAAVEALRYHCSPEAVGELTRFIEKEEVDDIKALAEEALRQIE